MRCNKCVIIMRYIICYIICYKWNNIINNKCNKCVILCYKWKKVCVELNKWNNKYITNMQIYYTIHSKFFFCTEPIVSIYSQLFLIE